MTRPVPVDLPPPGTGGAPADGAGSTHFRLRRQGLLNRSTALALLYLIYAVTAPAVVISAESELGFAAVLGTLGPLLLPAMGLVVWLNRRRNRFLQISITPAGIEYPRHWLLGAAPRRVPWSNLVSIERTRSFPLPALVIGFRGHFPLRLRSVDFESATLDRFEAALRSAVACAPEAAALDERLAVTERFLERRRGIPLAAPAIAVLLLASFAQPHLQAPAQDAVGAALQFGAYSDTLIAHGAWERLFTPLLLHFGAVHLVLNTVALLVLGILLERLVGVARFVATLLAGSLAGFLATWAFSDIAMSVGASGGLYALCGLYAVLIVRGRHRLPVSVQFAPVWWLLVVAATLLIPFAGSNHYAHLGGLVTGLAIGARFLRLDPLPVAVGSGFRVVTGVLAALFTAALVQSQWTALHWEPFARETVLRVLASPASANDLGLALRLALDDAPPDRAVLAELQQRLGGFPELTSDQRHLLAEAERCLGG